MAKKKAAASTSISPRSGVPSVDAPSSASGPTTITSPTRPTTNPAIRVTVSVSPGTKIRASTRVMSGMMPMRIAERPDAISVMPQDKRKKGMRSPQSASAVSQPHIFRVHGIGSRLIIMKGARTAAETSIRMETDQAGVMVSTARSVSAKAPLQRTARRTRSR